MNKDDKLQNTKNRLIEATLQLMESADDPLQVTSREIAKLADCKPAMINYCFGSREDLIYCVFQSLYQNYLDKDLVEKIIHSNLSPKDVLKRMHFIVAKCLVENYKFTKAITGFVLFKRDLSQESFSFPYVMKHYGGRKTAEECKVIAYELSTMMQLIVYRKEAMKNDLGIDLENEEELKKLIDLRVDLLLGN